VNNTKRKFLNAALIFTSLIGYLEWGAGNHSFLFQAEGEVLSKLFTDPMSVLHPFTLLPLFGQIILFLSLFQKTPSKIMTYIGLAGLAVLLFFITLVGVLGMNYKIVLSTVPFIVTSILVVKEYRKK